MHWFPLEPVLSLQKIKFGTDGWRAVIADEFTFSNVRAVTRAIAAFLEEEKREADGVVIGYDNRFLAEEFAAQSAAIFLERGMKVYLCHRPAPTPAVAFAVRHWRSAGACMFTASHNPARYQGIKFIPHYAGPALPEETDRISELLEGYLQKKEKNHLAAREAGDRAFDEDISMIRALLENSRDSHCAAGGIPAVKQGLLELIEPEGPYLKHLEGVIDTRAIAAAPPFVVLDSMYGAGIGYLEAFLLPLGCRLEVIRGYRDAFFGGTLPDPSRQNLEKLRDLVLKLQAAAGIALDGDADRLGIIGPDGKYINANDFLTLFLEYLVQRRNWQGVVVRTVATTHNLDRLAEYYGLRLVETPVGFKHIGHVMREEDAFLGGEESGGVSIRGHIPEKDGIMAALLFIEMLAVTGAAPQELLQRIASKIELLKSCRWDIQTTSQQKEKVLEKLKNWQPVKIAGHKVEKINRLDGLKIILQGGSWCLIRSSGTEDLFRIYLEASSAILLDRLGTELKRELGLARGGDA